jgi:hypothetical protein
MPRRQWGYRVMVAYFVCIETVGVRFAVAPVINNLIQLQAWQLDGGARV